MKILQVIILGIVQGIAEFLPISSSAHLIIFRDVFGIASFIKGNMELTFDLALHLGTLFAIIIFFFKDIIRILVNGFSKEKVHKKGGNLLWLLAIATIPAGIAGVLFEDTISDFFRHNYILISLALIFMGIVLYLCDKKSKQSRKMEDLGVKDAIIIGISQVFALIPGFSRSGMTILAARLLKVNREDSAKFSFFLSLPVVLGACALKLCKESTWTLIGANVDIFIIGMLASFITGILSIKFLLKYLDNHNFKVFMIYRILIAIVVILVVTIK